MRTAFEREGDVRSVDLPGAFAALWRERASGVLSFSRPESRVRFEILDGAVVGASSSDPSFDAAEVLVRAGKLDPAVFEGRRISRGRDRARFARDEGFLTERDWRWGEKIRTVEILSDLVGWLEGRYSFDPEESPEPGEIRVGIDRLILELFLRSRDREFVHQSLGAVDAPLQRAADFDETFPSLGLTADAALVAAAIEGRATAAEISRRVPPDPFSVEKLLAALTTLGLVHPEYAAPARTRAAPVAAPPGPVPEPEAPSVSVPEVEAVEPEPPEVEFEPILEPEPVPPPRIALDETPPPPPSAIELPLGPVADPAEPEPLVTGWEPGPPDPMDQPLALTEPPELQRSSRPGVSPIWLLVALGIAVGALLVFRSRNGGTEAPLAAAAEPTASPEPATAPPTPTHPPLAAVLPPSPTAAIALPTPVPTAPAAPTALAARSVPSDRRQWLERAERDRRALARDRRTRFTIQLELVCELPSVQEAWHYDRGGRMWLLVAEHRGRECFRVFWGRYATVEEARAAKGSVPRFFFTPTNVPAVIATRPLLP
jgi:hypothetical protein